MSVLAFSAFSDTGWPCLFTTTTQSGETPDGLNTTQHTSVLVQTLSQDLAGCVYLTPGVFSPVKHSAKITRSLFLTQCFRQHAQEQHACV